MGKVVVTAFMTVDAVIESPEKWSFPYWNKDIEHFKDEELRAADAQLLGRKTYELFAEAWPSRTGQYAERLNGTPKYVVSTTLQQAHWNNSHVVAGGNQLDAQVRQLKERHAGNLLVHGSHSLVQALVQRDLVDEYHVLVYPLALGEGRRLFAEGGKANLQLAASSEMGAGVVLLVYRRG